METHVAKRKIHRCDECGKRIPIGARYFVTEKNNELMKEHTNCMDYKNEPDLDEGFKYDRSAGEKWYTPSGEMSDSGRPL